MSKVGKAEGEKWCSPGLDALASLEEVLAGANVTLKASPHQNSVPLL